ncbi:MAG: hypothetical protein AAB895_01015, partial [Patescibacteria group bacterium]
AEIFVPTGISEDKIMSHSSPFNIPRVGYPPIILNEGSIIIVDLATLSQEAPVIIFTLTLFIDSVEVQDPKPVGGFPKVAPSKK